VINLPRVGICYMISILIMVLRKVLAFGKTWISLVFGGRFALKICEFVSHTTVQLAMYVHGRAVAKAQRR
jgi:hypothetical protein